MQKSEALPFKKAVRTRPRNEGRTRVIGDVDSQPILVETVGFLPGLDFVFEDFPEVIEGRCDCMARR